MLYFIKPPTLIISRCVPVGHIWKFDLEEYKLRNFWIKFIFSKYRIEPVMLNFLAKTENLKRQDQNNRLTIAGKRSI